MLPCLLPVYSLLVRPVDRVHVLGGLSPSPDGRIVVRFHFLLALFEKTSLSAFNAFLLVSTRPKSEDHKWVPSSNRFRPIPGADLVPSQGVYELRW